jgi:hypothetical protein
MATKLLQDDKGNVSAGRLIAMLAALVGVGIACSGTVAMFLELPASVAAMGTGAGMVATSMAGKAFQKRYENGHAAGR